MKRALPRALSRAEALGPAFHLFDPHSGGHVCQSIGYAAASQVRAPLQVTGFRCQCPAPPRDPGDQEVGDTACPRARKAARDRCAERRRSAHQSHAAMRAHVVLLIGSGTCRSDDTVLDGADTVNLAPDDVSRLQEARRSHGDADAARRSRREQVTRLQRERRREV